VNQKKIAYCYVTRRCEHPNLTEDDANPSHDSGLDDGTDHIGVFNTVPSTRLTQSMRGTAGLPEVFIAVRASLRTTSESLHMILYMIPPVISELVTNMDQPQATVISRVTGNSLFS
jgi:hypothetical protein